MEEEKKYLNQTLSALNLALTNLEKSIEESSKQVDDLLEFISRDFTDMDKEEIAVQSTILSDEELKLSQKKELKEKLELQKDSPYFGSIVFDENGDSNKIYIGIGSVLSPDSDRPLVSDWRAPVSSLFYDYELGKAQYEAFGEIYEGEIKQKRQYKIEKSELKYYFDSGLTIEDELLQETLAKNVDGQMRNIVATIQKEQNQIIRNNSFENILVQGLAGSGKTSVALHRAAFLLYKHKDTLSSKNIFIISPNARFSSYISNVLPSLGERDIEQTTFYEIAKNELQGKVKIETREEMFDILITNKGIRLQELAIKESFEFLEYLKLFLNNFSKICFVPKDLKFGKLELKKEFLEKLFYQTYEEKSPKVRVDWISEYICDELKLTGEKAEQVGERVKNILYSMFVTTNIVDIYKEFLSELNLSQNIGEDKIHYEDVAPLLLIYDHIFGLTKNLSIKHLIVDEMQDYSPIYFEIISRLFDCKKTILGDIYQSILKNLNEEYLQELAEKFDCKVITMNKCYRSTKAITDFATGVLNIENVQSMRKEGEEVEVYDLSNKDFNLVEKIKEINEKFGMMAVICENQKNAEKLFVDLSEIENLIFLDEVSEMEGDNIYLMPVALSKGLEFNAVVVIMQKPSNQLLKKLHYVACSRALHKLVVVYIWKNILFFS